MECHHIWWEIYGILFSYCCSFKINAAYFHVAVVEEESSFKIIRGFVIIVRTVKSLNQKGCCYDTEEVVLQDSFTSAFSPAVNILSSGFVCHFALKNRAETALAAL